MNKLSAVSLPLSVTSSILVSHIGFISPVIAQEGLSELDFSTNFYLSANHLELNSPSLQLSSLNWQKSDHVSFNIFSNFDSLSTEANFNFAFVNQNYNPSIDLEHFKLQADKSTIIPNDTKQNYELSSTLERDRTTSPRLATALFIDRSLDQNNLDSKALSFTKVKDLRDISPTGWYYNALSRLIERYGCFAGFDDNTFRGDLSLTRYEFAAALNSCLKAIETIAVENLSDEAEFREFKKLTTEFESELSAIQKKTNNLDQRIASLEDRNFSATTILRGTASFIVAGAVGDNKAVPTGETSTEDIEDEITFSSRVQLNFETSFTGKDLLRTRIEAGNINAFGSDVTGTQMTFLGTSTNTDNSVRLGQIFYRFPLGDKGNVYIAGARQSASAFIPTLNRVSTVSLFGFNNPLYDLGFGAGGGIYYQFNDSIGAGATYYSGSPNSSETNKGFFNGDYSALGQITFTPSDSLGISFTYAHFFSPEPGATNNINCPLAKILPQLLTIST